MKNQLFTENRKDFIINYIESLLKNTNFLIFFLSFILLFSFIGFDEETLLILGVFLTALFLFCVLSQEIEASLSVEVQSIYNSFKVVYINQLNLLINLVDLYKHHLYFLSIYDDLLYDLYELLVLKLTVHTKRLIVKLTNLNMLNLLDFVLYNKKLFLLEVNFLCLQRAFDLLYFQNNFVYKAYYYFLNELNIPITDRIPTKFFQILHTIKKLDAKSTTLSFELFQSKSKGLLYLTNIDLKILNFYFINLKFSVLFFSLFIKK